MSRIKCAHREPLTYANYMDENRSPSQAVAAALRSMRIIGSMGRVTAKILADLARHGDVARAEVDAQARWFATRLIR